MTVKVGTLEYDVVANIENLTGAVGRIEKQNNKIAGSFRGLGAAIGSYFGYQTARSLLDVADNMALLDIRIRAVSKSQAEFNKNQAELIRIASGTGAGLASTVKIFESLKLSAAELGASNADVIRFTESVSKLGAVGGSTPDEMNNALRQLGQSLSAGVVRAEEFNSIIENTPAIAREIAAGLGVSNAELRTMMLNGELLSENVLRAILTRTTEIDERFAQIPDTIAKASNALSIQFGQALKDINTSLKITESLARSINALTTQMSEGSAARSARKKLEKEIEQILNGQAGAQEKQLKRANELLQSVEKRRNAIASRQGNPLLGEAAGSQQSYRRGQMQQIEAEERELVALAAKNTEIERLIKARAQLNALNQAGVVPSEKLAEEKSILEKPAGAKVETEEEKAKRLKAEEAAARKAEAAKERAANKAERDAERAANERLQREDDLKNLIESLSNETDQILIQYEDRNKKILELTAQGSKEQTELLIKSEGQKRAALAEIKVEESKMIMDANDRQASIDQAEKEAARERYTNLADDILNVMQRSGKDQTAVAKALFLSLRAIQIAQIIASTEAAAIAAGAQTAALGGPFAFFATAAGIRATGYASAGIVAGLAIADTFGGGGREAGGPVFAGAMHPINEKGEPEILQQGARQYLLPGNKSGNVSPLRAGGVGGMGSPKITINNTGAPLAVVSATVTRDEIKLMVKNAEDAAVSRVNSSLTQGRGPTANALRSGFKTERNIR